MMYALIAVSRNGKDSIILDCSADGDDTESWVKEFDSVGSYNPSDLGIIIPKKNGIFVWEGKVFYPPKYNQEGMLDDSEPDWDGIWRLATFNEIKRFIRGQHIWKVEIGLHNKIKSE